MTGSLRIGTSNGQMPGNKSTFPQAYQLKSRLHYYSTLFNTIEVNSSFYKTPLRSTYEKWAADVLDDFQFTLKLNRDITHAKELRSNLSLINKLLQAAGGVGNKKGCLLIQFPGKIMLEHFTQLENILEEIRIIDPDGEWRLAIEFRNESCYVSETIELLNEYNATMVLHDFLKARVSTFLGTSNFLSLRFHGPAGNYPESYSDQALDEKAKEIREYLATGKEIYAYFNNTVGNGFENARYLQAKFY